MKIVVETPKWSFVKYKFLKGEFVRDMLSPLPTIFNYGFIEGTHSGDDDPKDVLVLGRRLSQGTRLDLDVLGHVKFIDQQNPDYKAITSLNGRVTRFQKLKITIFFTVYAVFKTLKYLLSGCSHWNCRYEGLSVETLDIP